jgi:small subunit ribosomal protein S16
MATKLRLARYGSKKRPFYRIVAADSSARRDGRFLEQIGTYDPTKNPPAVSLDRERVKHWLSTGAEATDTVKMVIRDFLNSNDTAFRPSRPARPAAAE